uniref:Doublecortin domain-containing protein n=1 Tax=Syphacia muris TaxID=451379 RepID=A0A0N5AUN5_9BILA
MSTRKSGGGTTVSRSCGNKTVVARTDGNQQPVAAVKNLSQRRLEMFVKLNGVVQKIAETILYHDDDDQVYRLPFFELIIADHDHYR